MEEVKPRSIVLPVIVTVIITALVSGAIVYFWQQNVCLKKNSESTSKSTSTSDESTTSDTSSSTDDDVVTTQDMTAEGNSPTDIAEEFLMYTLGTLPGASVNLAKAKTYLSADQLSGYDESTFVQNFYGIQQGPDTYEMKTQTVAGDVATVRINVLYGSTMEYWAIIFISEGGEWKVNDFRNDAQ